MSSSAPHGMRLALLLLPVAATAVAAGAHTTNNISNVYVVWSNHYDMGYTKNENGSCATSVVNQYFTQHFPKAIETARQAAAMRSDPFVYRWTTQSWLVNAYRHCNETRVNIDGPSAPSMLSCPTAAELAAFEGAVRNGTITWHAFPFNGEMELFDATMAEAALNLTFAEDAYFGRTKRRDDLVSRGTLKQRQLAS